MTDRPNYGQTLSEIIRLDMDIHHAALWSSINELTEQSARHGDLRVNIPDF